MSYIGGLRDGAALLKAFVKKQKNQSFFIVDFIKNHSFFTKNL